MLMLSRRGGRRGGGEEEKEEGRGEKEKRVFNVIGSSHKREKQWLVVVWWCGRLVFLVLGSAVPVVLPIAVVVTTATAPWVVGSTVSIRPPARRVRELVT